MRARRTSWTVSGITNAPDGSERSRTARAHSSRKNGLPSAFARTTATTSAAAASPSSDVTSVVAGSGASGVRLTRVTRAPVDQSPTWRGRRVVITSIRESSSASARNRRHSSETSSIECRSSTTITRGRRRSNASKTSRTASNERRLITSGASPPATGGATLGTVTRTSMVSEVSASPISHAALTRVATGRYAMPVA